MRKTMTTFSFKDLSDQIINMLPPDLKLLKKDLNKSIQHLIETTFAKFDLITREEFDVQTKVLARTRQKIENLEKQIAALQTQIDKNIHDE